VERLPRAAPAAEDSAAGVEVEDSTAGVEDAAGSGVVAPVAGAEDAAGSGVAPASEAEAPSASASAAAKAARSRARRAMSAALMPRSWGVLGSEEREEELRGTEDLRVESR
jgi:hypothetical protein